MNVYRMAQTNKKMKKYTIEELVKARDELKKSVELLLNDFIDKYGLEGSTARFNLKGELVYEENEKKREVILIKSEITISL